MSQIDVRDLQRESLPEDSFPADAKADFRFFMTPEVRRGIEEHAKKDDSVEICGVLVGRWGQDAQGPFAAATNYIRCETAASKFAEVTFTHESWAQINQEMDTKYDDKRIVGWYHSHPDFGIFLSDRDCFIQEHFFSGPGQVAYVIDPVRDDEGVFAWHAGKPKLLPHFWIGDAIRTPQPDRNRAHRTATPMHAVAAAGNATTANAPNALQLDQSWLGTLTTVLSWLAIFLLGFLYANWWSSRQQEAVVRGAAARIAHLAEMDVLKIGMEEDLDTVLKRLTAISNEFKKVPKADAELKPEEIKEAAKQRQAIAANLNRCKLEIALIAEKYGLSRVEHEAIDRARQQYQAKLLEAMEKGYRKATEEAEKKQTSAKDAKKPPEPPKKSTESEAPPKD